MYLLSYTVVQVAVQEERLGSQEVEGDTHSIDEGDRPEGSTIAQVLGNDATQEDAQSLRGTKMLAQIERQQWCEYVEGEEEGEIGYHHLAVVAVPESLVGHGAICRK